MAARHYEGEGQYWYSPPEGSGYGWSIFAGTILMIAATLNGIDGIAAVSSSSFFAHGVYIVGDLNTWGWILIAISVVQGLCAVGVWMQNDIARWTGVGIASANAVVQLLFIPAYPFWSLALFSLDLLVIYGLVVHGSSQEA
jgi:hypothetical protein